MRINGLLRTFRSVRAQLRAGLAPDEVEPYVRRVKSVVASVDSICARNGLTPDHLPGPSRRVYRFLKELKPEQIPARPSAPVAPAPKTGIGLRNIVKIEGHFAERLWHDLGSLAASDALQKQFRAHIERNLAAIHAICARHHATAAALETPSRQVYCWLRFLADPNNLGAHFAGLQNARETLQTHAPWLDRPVTVHLLNMGALWRRRDDRNLTLVKISQGFVNAGADTWSSLMRSILGGPDTKRDPAVMAYAHSEDYGEVLAELDAFADNPDATGLRSTQGHVHNLDESFARVNAACFGGAMPRPKLEWNRALTGRKFGHYRFSTDTVMLSVSLDMPDVPALAVDFVMYHELLHKRHGVIMVNGRRIAHSAAFRADERRFARYEEAERLLNELAARH